jgi:hypothetical protein
MAAAILVWKAASGALPNAILSLGGILIGMLVYGFGLWALKNRELEMLIQAVRSRLFKK